MKINFEVDINDDIIDSMLVSAVEGAGIGYWAHVASIKGKTGNDMYRGMTVYENESHEHGKPPVVCVMDDAAIQRGLQVMAQKHPRDFADVVRENDDAATADVLIQCAMFGELIYG